MKKLLVVGVIVLFLGLAIPFSTGIFIEKKSIFVKEIDTVPCYLNVDNLKVVPLQNPSKMAMPYQDSIIIHDEGRHPTVSGDKGGRFFACFEVEYQGDYYPDFWYSLDGGVVWEEVGYFSESLGSQYPDSDSNAYAFYATFDSGEIDRGQVWLVAATRDFHVIQGYPYSFSSSGFDDFEFFSISCYTKADAEWDFGGIAFTGYNGYQTNDVNGCPFIFYPGLNWTKRVWLVWLSNCEDYLHSDFAIDEVTEMSYAVWDNEVEANLLVRKDNFGVRDAEGRHPYVGAYSVGDGETNLSNPSIEAHDNNVVLVCEEAGDIVCIYSSNGFSSQLKCTVVNNATIPEVKVTFDGELFVCSYVKDGAVYRKISEDGGATWTDEKQIDDSQAVGEYGVHDLGKGEKGIYAVFEGAEGICFGQVCSDKIPDPPSFSFSGPLGITATIKNIGDVEATEVEWTLHVTGGVFEHINKSRYGYQSVLRPGEELYAKSGIIIGLGKISVIATFSCAECPPIKDDIVGMQVFFLSLL